MENMFDFFEYFYYILEKFIFQEEIFFNGYIFQIIKNNNIIDLKIKHENNDDCHFSLYATLDFDENYGYVHGISNKIADKIIRGSGICFFMWFYYLCVFLGIVNIKLTDDARITDDSSGSIPYREYKLYKLYRLYEEKRIRPEILLEMNFEDLSYYNRFGAVDVYELSKPFVLNGNEELKINDLYIIDKKYFTYNEMIIKKLPLPNNEFISFLKKWNLNDFFPCPNNEHFFILNSSFNP